MSTKYCDGQRRKNYWKRIDQYWHGRCSYCLSNKGYTLDHFIPKKKGGKFAMLNLVPACYACNNEKGSNHPIDWCSKDQMNHIMRYFNALMLNEYNVNNGNVPSIYRGYISLRMAIGEHTSVKRLKLDVCLSH